VTVDAAVEDCPAVDPDGDPDAPEPDADPDAPEPDPEPEPVADLVVA